MVTLRKERISDHDERDRTRISSSAMHTRGSPSRGHGGRVLRSREWKARTGTRGFWTFARNMMVFSEQYNEEVPLGEDRHNKVAGFVGYRSGDLAGLVGMRASKQ